MTYPTQQSSNALPKGKLSSLGAMKHFIMPYRWGVIGATISLLFTSGAVLGIGSGLRYLVDEGISKGNLELLNNAFIILLGVVIILAAATFMRYYLVSSVGEKVVADIRNAVYQKIITMDVTFFETTRTGELISRITTDTTLLQNVVGSSISIFMRNALLFTGGLIMLMITSIQLTQYIFIILPIVVIPIIVLGKKVRALSRETQEKVADISVHAEETIGAVRTIHAMTLEQSETDRFGNHVQHTLDVSLKRIRMRAWLTAIVIALVFGAIATVLWVGGRAVISEEITAGDLSAFIFYAVVVAGATGAVSEVIGELQRAAGATERLMELLKQTPNIVSAEDPTALPSPLKGKIIFNSVEFSYPSRPEQPALSNVTFTVNPGETIAIVGPSGAGKTTLIQLLLRFYDPISGSVSIDGIDVRNLDLQEWRGAVGLVPQDPVIFSADAWTNIRYGRESASDDEVLDAARAAHALDFLEHLPNGLDTYLGEKGVRLSGGQRQRIAIARAILRDPSILLLDEATSALDSASETKVQEALHRLSEQRTTMVIAHRLSTVTNADMILVMDQGRLVAHGTHQELFETNELYRTLATLQFTQAT